MRLKEIKPGMVIHCKNDEEKKALLEEAERLGYLWPNGVKPTKAYLPSNTLVFREDGLKKIYCTGGSENNTEFSDLIMPELTAEEVIDWLGTYYNNGSVCNETFGNDYSISGMCSKFTPKGVVEKISKWKSDHEKKEPEIEWVYRVFGAENYGEKFFQTEEEAINRCEELAKSQKTKRYARYERICRVKAVE